MWSKQDWSVAMKSAFSLAKGWKLNMLWICLVMICALATFSGYCVSINPTEGFEYSICR